ncbi:MAG: molybdopterin-dependent oxidoreductase, partial [Chromatiales bacterium]
GRGEHMKIGTYVARTVDSELSGNVIDLCPVGALTSKPFLFRARAWELHQYPSIAPHDSVGSNLYVHVRRGEAMRVVPRDNEPVNECWISDRDRFSYQGLGAPDRLTQPMIRRDGRWREADWQEALEAAAQILKRAGAGLGALVSPRATLEEAYLAQKITRGLGSGSVDHRLRQGDFRGPDSEPPLAWLGLPIAELERVQAALVVGGNPRKDQPLLGHRLRKAARSGATVAYLNPLALDLTYEATQIIAAPSAMARELAAVGKALGLSGPLVRGAKVDDAHRLVAGQLKEARDSVVLLGNLAQAHPDYAVLRALASRVAEAAGSRLGYLLEGANSLGARMAGALPTHGPGGRPANPVGAHAGTLLSERQKAYLLVDIDPGLDCWDPAAALRTLSGDSPVVALSAFRSPSLEACADVLLPIAAFTETSGTYVNAEGRWQGFGGVARPRGEARPGWKVLRVLGNLLDLEGFEHVSSEEIRAEVGEACDGAAPDNAAAGSAVTETLYAGGDIERVGEVPIYASDSLVRRAPSLQRTADGRAAQAVRVARVLAERLGVNDGAPIRVVQGEGRLERPLHIDDRVPDGCAWMPAGVDGSERLGGQVGNLILEKV